jgi:hypothetical protein
MKFLPTPTRDSSERSLIFQIAQHEEALLLAILRLYPVMENEHHRLTKDPKPADSSGQQLLEEAMSQQRTAFRKKVDQLFRSPHRFFKDADGERRLVLTREQLEWMLKVLNDIRIGSWVKMGCPDLDKPRPVEISRENARSLQAMHISGQFQLVLLEASK